MSLLASLRVLLGVDAIDFKKGLADAVGRTEAFSGSMARAGDKMRSQLGGSFSIVAMTAQANAAKIAAAAETSTAALLPMGTAAQGVATAVGNATNAALLGAGAIGKLSLMTAPLSKLGPEAALGIGILAKSTLELSYAAGAALAEITGLNNALRSAAKPAEDIAAALAGDETRFRTAADQLTRLKSQLHLTGAAWDFAAERSKSNATRIVELTGKILENRNAYHVAKTSLDAYLLSLEKSTGLHERNAATLDLARSRFHAAYGVFSKAELIKSMGTVVTDVSTLATDGVAAGQVLGAVASRVETLAAAARTYKNFKLPDDFDALLTAVRSGEAAFEAYITKIAGVGPDTAKSLEASRKYLDDWSTRLAGSVSGGFGRGAQEGVNFAQQQFEEWRRKVETTPIRLTFDTSEVTRAISNALGNAGRMPRLDGMGVR